MRQQVRDDAVVLPHFHLAIGTNRTENHRTATLAREVQETTVIIKAQARKKLSTTTSATATDKNSHEFAHGLWLAVDCAQPDREAERAWAAQTTGPPGFDAVPRPPGASSGVLAPSNPNPLQLAPPASQPKISDRVGQPPAQSDTAQPANSPGSGPVADITPLMHGLH
jgi:hypothetical protein